MATPTILDFYRYSVPRGINIKQRAEWTTSASASVVITASTGMTYFIQGIEFFLDPASDLGSSAMTIAHSADTFGGVNSSTITISSINALVASWAPATENVVACNLFGTLVFDIPVILNATQTLTIAYSGGTSGITAGQVNFGITGWYIPTTSL